MLNTTLNNDASIGLQGLYFFGIFYRWDLKPTIFNEMLKNSLICKTWVSEVLIVRLFSLQDDKSFLGPKFFGVILRASFLKHIKLESYTK